MVLTDKGDYCIDKYKYIKNCYEYNKYFIGCY